jgi:dipeptidyl aminopeptidase/acylaminoacyl peptidase
MDAEEQTLVAIAEAMPWLSRSELVVVESFEVETKDGLKVESFLALPKTREGELPPLLVMPHGGPIGVRDTRGFDPTVQYFASNGFAVLQVNYRGSAGRGSSFLEAGKQAWGREIEDDIETAVDHLVAQGRADKNRMCIFGSSYGGYSALISTTRRPQRYKCAVAFAAPTDLLLLFDGELAQDDETRDLLTEIVGDPDRDELIRTSPAYRAAEMDTPILLIYGQDDRRVDVEHGHRMRVMLELHEKSHEWMLLEGTDHSPDSKQWIRIIVRVARFLREHLIQ